MEKIYRVEELDCAHCGAKIEEAVRSCPGVEAASLVFVTRQLRVTAADPDALLPELRALADRIEPGVRIESAGEGKQNAGHGGCESCGHEEHHHAGHSHEGHSHDGHEEGESAAPILVGLGGFVLGAVLGLAGLDLPGKLLYAAAYLVLGWEVLASAAKGLVRGHMLDENFLMGIATLGAFAIGEFPEAVGVMLFYRVGEYFEDRAVNRSRKQIMDAVDLRPETVTLFGEPPRTIPAAEAKAGDLLLVRPGDRIPLDGVVVSGESRLDTAPITGESVPVAARPGDAVLSGCVNLSGQLVLRAEKPLEDSMVTRILRSVESAAAGKPRMERFITRFARIYTPVVVALAAAVAVIPSLCTGDWGYWVYTALSFLVISCPCALVLSVPLAFFSGIGLAGRQGILFKSGASMEALCGVSAVAMDKTGTLTKGNFRVREDTPDALLRLCASCEQYSSHPIAVSMVAAAGERGLPLTVPERVEELPGRGVRAELDGKTVLCGNEKLMAAFGVEALPEQPGCTLAHCAVDGEYLGYVAIADEVKAEAPAAVAALEKMGLTTALLTGDNAPAARAAAEALGIRRVFAGLLPEEKLDAVKRLREEAGPVMFVGDGINDAPVLSGADVGAAMGGGADAALEAADVVLMTADPASVPRSVAIARRARAAAWQNVAFALAVKALVMVLGLTGNASMWLAVLADSGVALLCVLNSVRMLYGKQK